MKHLIMGTAGHIDHGKTALVKALTGTDCDTHKEEKRRGITINLGFAHLALDSGDTVGIVDVPGHRDFVHTMVSGASGIDFALLVIAADEGVMPQTREHVRIMEILGITKGIVALTKIDRVDEGGGNEADHLIRAFAKGSILESWPVIKVSSLSGAGIDNLKRSISQIALEAAQRPEGGIFRMYIDRVFSVSGFGTVVTGSVKSGELHVGDAAYLLPGAKPLRVRRLERYGEPVDVVYAGDRASCNCAGMDRADFRRGMLISNRKLDGTLLLDAALTLFSESPQIGLWTHAVFLLGSFESRARIHALDKNKVAPGQTALVQIHLGSECVALAGDRFVIRSASGDATIGGGVIIDSAPLHHRRRTKALLGNLSTMVSGGLPGRVAAEIRKSMTGMSAGFIAERLGISEQETAAALKALASDDIKTVASPTNRYAITAHSWEILKKKVVSALRAFHKANPLMSQGRGLEDLRGVIGAVEKDPGDEFPAIFLESLVGEGALKKIGESYALPEHAVSMSKDERESALFVESYFKNCGMQTPILSDLEKQSQTRGVDEKKLKGILRFLTDNGVLRRIEGSYLFGEQVDVCRAKLLNALRAKTEGLTVAEFRDVVEGNRKICLMLFALFEQEGIVRRVGDLRVLTPKGEEAPVFHSISSRINP